MTARARAHRWHAHLLVGPIALVVVAACGGSSATPTAAVVVPTSAVDTGAALTSAAATAPTSPAVATSAPIATAAAACVAPPAGIVAWWRAENDTTDTIGTDDATLKAGATFAPGKVGTAFSFDGTQQYAEVSASNLQLKTAMTIEGWVYASGTPASYAGLAGTWDDNTGANCTYLFWVLNGELELLISPDGGSFQRATDPTPLPPDTWTHVAGTYDGTAITIYVDGVEVGHAAMTGAIATNGRPFTIGRTDGGSTGTPNYWKGSIDELTVYDRALSAAEIAAIHGAGSAGKCPA